MKKKTTAAAKPSKGKAASANPNPCEALTVQHKLTELFWVIGPAFTRWADSHMHENGLSPQRVRLMWQLIENGPMMMSALRDELGYSATNITALVDLLEEEKMVKRMPHATDRRATLIAITPKAEKLMMDKCGEFRDRVAGLFSEFTKSDQDKLLLLLLQVRDALIDRRILEHCDISCTAQKKK